MEQQVLAAIGKKIGLSSQKAIRQAGEYLRLADIRSASSSLGSLNLSGSCKAVLCLDLAARCEGEPLTKSSCLRASGTKNAKLYNSALRALECLLDLQPRTSIADLAIQFTCTSAKTLAAQIIHKYGEKQGDLESGDFSKALFNTAALFCACRHQKLKVDKRKMTDQAGVKKATFDRLVAEMDKIAVNLTKGSTSGPASRKSKNFLDSIDIIAGDDVSPSKRNKAPLIEKDPSQESYEVWRARILTQAYSALGQTYTPS